MTNDQGPIVKSVATIQPSGDCGNVIIPEFQFAHEPTCNVRCPQSQDPTIKPVHGFSISNKLQAQASETSSSLGTKAIFNMIYDTVVHDAGKAKKNIHVGSQSKTPLTQWLCKDSNACKKFASRSEKVNNINPTKPVVTGHGDNRAKVLSTAEIFNMVHDLTPLKKQTSIVSADSILETETPITRWFPSSIQRYLIRIQCQHLVPARSEPPPMASVSRSPVPTGDCGDISTLEQLEIFQYIPGEETLDTVADTCTFADFEDCSLSETLDAVLPLADIETTYEEFGSPISYNVHDIDINDNENMLTNVDMESEVDVLLYTEQHHIILPFTGVSSKWYEKQNELALKNSSRERRKDKSFIHNGNLLCVDTLC